MSESDSSSVGTPPSQTQICAQCRLPPPTGFVTRAAHGHLEAVCRRCFLVHEIGTLAAGLTVGDAAHSQIEGHLESAYQVARAAYESQLAHQSQAISRAILALVHNATESES